ncbi:chromatin remodeling complex subunit [Dacryopinax primogenitus]|uniref:Chromatin remodeling complex subunit n=1 Tax=Dacryopinax primogenitus (strain DJM 731) TaxID=1858805 RepID=M5FTX8_DACPD|nr:chromatin remodeling complex subunit [Dacryopinax primogenitus]EJT98924.1 chromatin remodeling complex subunit [Dacryopinax primogenitus]
MTDAGASGSASPFEPPVIPLSVPPSTPYIPVLTNYREVYYPDRVPIVIDNGATNFRAGFGTDKDPYIVVDNLMSKYRDRKTNTPVLLFGNELVDDATTRSNAKSPFDGDICVNPEGMETAFDWTFIKLGIDDEKVDHTVLMTERIASPLASRAFISELLFEAYDVPSVLYGPDGYFSMYANAPPSSSSMDGVVVSFNTQSTSMWPVLGGEAQMNQAKRIPFGGTQAIDLLLKFVQLKYPSFPTRVTSAQAAWIFQTCCEFTPGSLIEKVRELTDPLKLKQITKIVQFPFVAVAVQQLTEEELERQAEKRREAGRRLQETSARIRLEKLVEKENNLEYYTNLRDWRNREKRSSWLARLEDHGFETEAEFESTIRKLETSITAARRKEAGLEEPPAEEAIPTFPLLDRPDADLTEEELKEKRKQRLMKAGYDARMRARAEKEREGERKRQAEKEEEEERERDLKGWSDKLKREHEAVMDKIKDRKRKQAALSDRKSMAAQQRMRSIANLAADTPTGNKRRKRNQEDMFGADDEDWAIYRKVHGAEEDDDEEEDFARLESIENKLLAYDPGFDISLTFAARESQRSALLNAFRPIPAENNVAASYQLWLNTERIRVPETWFNPSIAGVDCAGVGEVLTGILRSFGEAERDRLIQNIHVTGGPSQLPGLPERLHYELAQSLPFGARLAIRPAKDARLDAWRGMAQFSRTEGLQECLTTREMYNEWGAERMKAWRGGNWTGAVGIDD